MKHNAIKMNSALSRIFVKDADSICPLTSDLNVPKQGGCIATS
jgi:hypothetical protein